MNDPALGETDSAYDANDRLLTETLGGTLTKYTYDNNGNTLSKFTSAVDQALYEWDSQNRMVGATVTDATGTKHIAYAYDADGIRVSSKVDTDVTRYLIDTVQPYAQVLEEYTPGGVIQVSYVYGNGLISQNRNGSKSFYHVDGLGSTRALTNASGAVTDRYVYDAFGRMIEQTGSTVNVYLFAGEQRDANVELDYLRARYLDFHAGRFYGTDKARAVASSPIGHHAFLYSQANPVNRIDPSGSFSFLTGSQAHAAIGAEYEEDHAGQDVEVNPLSSVLDWVNIKPDILIWDLNSFAEIKPLTLYGVYTGPIQQATYEYFLLSEYESFTPDLWPGVGVIRQTYAGAEPIEYFNAEGIIFYTDAGLERLQGAFGVGTAITLAEATQFVKSNSVGWNDLATAAVIASAAVRLSYIVDLAEALLPLSFLLA
jgi:RHS repeat-associated protein